MTSSEMRTSSGGGPVAYIYPIYEVWVLDPKPPIGEGKPVIFGETASRGIAYKVARHLEACDFPGVEVRRIPNQLAITNWVGDLDGFARRLS